MHAKRMLLLVTAAAVAVAMLGAVAVPGFAAEKCEFIGGGFSCRGGAGERGGTDGTAGQESSEFDPQTGILDVSQTGGGGHGAGGPGVRQGGGGGVNVDGTIDTNTATVDIQARGGSGHGGSNFEPDGGGGGQCSFDDRSFGDSQPDEQHGSACPLVE